MATGAACPTALTLASRRILGAQEQDLLLPHPVSSFSLPVSERTLGARDYKLAVEEGEQQARRSSVVSELGSEDATTADGEKGKIYGARDYKLIGKETS